MGAVTRRMTGYRPNPIPGIDIAKPYDVVTVGCGSFWGVEKFYRYGFPKQLRATACGYMGIPKPDFKPTYDNVAVGDTGFAQVVQIQYYPDLIKYEDLIRYFYRIHDPTTKDRQGEDIGTQYRSVIFCHSPEQFARAREVTREMTAKWGDQILTTELCLAPMEHFHVAEPENQLYLEKHPDGYCNHKLRFTGTGEPEVPSKPEDW